MSILCCTCMQEVIFGRWGQLGYLPAHNSSHACAQACEIAVTLILASPPFFTSPQTSFNRLLAAQANRHDTCSSSE